MNTLLGFPASHATPGFGRLLRQWRRLAIWASSRSPPRRASPPGIWA